MFSEIKSAGLFGLNAFMVTVQASIAPGQPSFDIVGMPDIAVQESKARIRAVLGHLELKLLNGKVTVNLAPASVRKIGSMFDLPIITALMKLGGLITADLSDSVFIGELSLDGKLAPVNGALSMVLTAAQNGAKRVFLPKANAKEASVADCIEVYGVEHVAQIMEFLRAFSGGEVCPEAARRRSPAGFCGRYGAVPGEGGDRGRGGRLAQSAHAGTSRVG